MKVFNDFITNSSSSNVVVGFKAGVKPVTLSEYSSVITTQEELDDKRENEEIYDEDTYNRCKQVILSGGTVVIESLDRDGFAVYEAFMKKYFGGDILESED